MKMPNALPSLLVVDDDHFILRQVSHIARNDFIVVTAASPADVTDDMLAGLDTLILDLKIPDSDSVMFLMSLASRAASIRLIIASGLELKTIKLMASVARSMKFRSVDIMQKPFTASMLTPMLLCGRALRDSWIEIHEAASPLKIDLAAELPRSLRLNEMAAYFQPQVSLHDGKFVGAEALCRWEHPSLGIIMPADFIEHVEDQQIAMAFTLYMAEEAIRGFKYACEATRTTGHLSVNFPISVLQEPKLAHYLSSILEKHHFSPSKFIVEITERGISEDSTKSSATIAQLRIRGFKISLDDFGTGYSSFEKLKDIAIDEIKIDRLFVSDAVNSHTSQTLILAALKIAEELQLQVVAEGIENAETASWLAGHGTIIGQGYLFSRALHVQELVSFIKRAPAETAILPGFIFPIGSSTSMQSSLPLEPTKSA